MSGRHESRRDVVRRGQERAAVRNAADPRQVRLAERIERQRTQLFEDSLVAVMSTAEGRAVVWALIRKAGVYESVWDPSAKIHYLAGRQDYGHELMADIHRVCPELWLQMESEARAHEQRIAEEIEAHHTRQASEQE